MALIYLLLFVAPQVVLYAYLRERLPDAGRPGRAHLVRAGLAAVFAVFNFPWLFVAQRVLFGSVWGMGRIPYLGPWIAWQMLGWIFAGLVTIYIAGKAVVWLTKKVRGEWRAVRDGAQRGSAPYRQGPLPPPRDVLSRRRFLARATYAYAAAGAALSVYGIWNAERLPDVTRRTLTFPDLPPGLDGLRLLHLSDVHAGIHMEQDKRSEEHTSELQSRPHLVCRLLLEKKKMLRGTEAEIRQRVGAGAKRRSECQSSLWHDLI